MSLYTQPEKIETVVVPVSFETGQLGSFRVYFPYKVRVLKARSRVTKALGATDNGTLTLGTSTSAFAGNNVITHLPSAAFGNEVVVTPTGGIVQAGDYVEIFSAKGTAGGTANVQLDVIRL